MEASSSRRSRGARPTRSSSGTSSPKASTSRTRRSASSDSVSIYTAWPGSTSGSGSPAVSRQHASPSPASRRGSAPPRLEQLGLARRELAAGACEALAGGVQLALDEQSEQLGATGGAGGRL